MGLKIDSDPNSLASNIKITTNKNSLCKFWLRKGNLLFCTCKSVNPKPFSSLFQVLQSFYS